MDQLVIKKNDLELHISPVGACIDAFYAFGLKIADRGITVGRYANRIAGASFVLDGMEYKLNANEGRNLLHGGKEGFDKKLWTVVSHTDDKLVFVLDSPDGDQGFPGNLRLIVSFSLCDNVLTIDYDAFCDKDCFVNFTNHSYFNLNDGNNVFRHRLFINSGKYTEVDKHLIPTGRILDASGTKYDYTEECDFKGGLDTNFVLEDGPFGASFLQSGELKLAAVLTGTDTGITVKCMTTEPGVQVYDEGPCICLETQHYPDSPHYENFPSTLLKAGTHYLSTTKYIISKQ